MKGIIIYKTKYGTTEKYAELIADETGLDAVNIDRFDIKDIYKYDYIVIGSPTYAYGLIAGGWIKKNKKTLLNKKVFLFSVGGIPAEDKDMLNKIAINSIGKDLFSHITYCHCRGVFKYNKLSFGDKLLMKIAIFLTKSPDGKKKMLEGYDLFDKVYVGSLINDIKALK